MLVWAMIYTAAINQGAMKVFWLHFWRAKNVLVGIANK